MGSDEIQCNAWKPSLLAILCFHWGMLMVVGLKLENVSVPPTGILGSSVTLGCDYSLESDQLFSLKWYRDGDEFFKYLPGRKDSPIITFNLQGVHVDLGASLKVDKGHVRLRLRNLTLSSVGTYRCEISADTPSFQTLHKEGNLSIIDLPESPAPVLSGFPTIVKFAELIQGNCTSDTYPAADVTMYLNNAKINSSNGEELIRYDGVKVGSRFQSTVGVRFRVSPKYFKYGVLQVRCEARLFDKKWESIRNVSHQNYQPPFYTAGQNQYDAGKGASHPVSLSVISVLLSIIYWWC